jgi:hypothetical protein
VSTYACKWHVFLPKKQHTGAKKKETQHNIAIVIMHAFRDRHQNESSSSESDSKEDGRKD